MFPTNGECLIGISDAFFFFFPFCLRVSAIFPTCSLYPQQKGAYSALHPQALTYNIQLHARRHLLSAVPWISEDRLLIYALSPAKGRQFCMLRVLFGRLFISLYSLCLGCTIRCLACLRLWLGQLFDWSGFKFLPNPSAHRLLLC